MKARKWNIGNQLLRGDGRMNFLNRWQYVPQIISSYLSCGFHHNSPSPPDWTRPPRQSASAGRHSSSPSPGEEQTSPQTFPGASVPLTLESVTEGPCLARILHFTHCFRAGGQRGPVTLADTLCHSSDSSAGSYGEEEEEEETSLSVSIRSQEEDISLMRSQEEDIILARSPEEDISLARSQEEDISLMRSQEEDISLTRSQEEDIILASSQSQPEGVMRSLGETRGPGIG